jgi:peptidoglycan hydrolase CwlO-like protein
MLKRALLALVRFLIICCVGVAATLAWQSYGDAAREKIANSYPQLGWLAPRAEPIAQNAPGVIALGAQAAPSPDQQQLNAISLDLDAVRQSIDQIVSNMATNQEQITRSVDQIAASVATNQEQITRSVDQLAVSQEWITREITKIEEIEQSIRYRNSEPLPPSPRPAPASAPKPVTRPAATSALAPKPAPRPSAAPTVP